MLSATKLAKNTTCIDSMCVDALIHLGQGMLIVFVGVVDVVVVLLVWCTQITAAVPMSKRFRLL